jgi:hypothetical protein
LASCSNDFDAVESVDEFVGEEIKVCSFPAFTTDATTRAVDEKTSWTSNDTIYVQLNGKGEWYKLSYSDSKWSAPEGFSMKKTDTYKAVYAPNYELNSANDALMLKSDAKASTAEYLTCEGTRPIEINFTRNYSRLRISSATANTTISVSFGEGFTANDGSGVKSFELTTDGDGDAYVYGSWNAETKLDIESTVEGNPSEDVAYAVASSGKTIKSESVNGKAYTTASPTDVWYVYNIDRAKTAKTSWNDVAQKGYSNIKIVGTWDGSNVKIDFEGQENLSKLDLSEVKNLTILPEGFCQESSFSEVKLPDCLTSISDFAFFYANIKSIDIPASVTSIGDSAFMGCQNFDFIICRAVIPPSTEIYTFSYANIGTLYVPDGSEDAYKNTYWGSISHNGIKPLSELNQ